MSQILLSIYGVFAVCWVNAIGRQIRNLVSVLTLRILVRRETMWGWVICTRLLEGGGCGAEENAQTLQMVNVTLRVVSWLCLLRVRLGFVLGKDSFGSGRLWHAAVIWMGPPSSVDGNFICTAVMLRGEAFQRLGQEVRALMNGSMVSWQGSGSFCWRMLQVKGCSAWPLHICFPLLFSLSHSFSLCLLLQMM